MKSIYLFLLLLFGVVSAAQIEVSGTVRSAADSAAVNGQIVVYVGGDSTVLEVKDGVYSGTVTGLGRAAPALPQGFSLQVYPTVLTAQAHTVRAEIRASRPSRRDQWQVRVYNILGQRVDISRPLSFQPLIIRVRGPFGSAARMIRAAGPFTLQTILHSRSAGGFLRKASAADSVLAVFHLRIPGYYAQKDTVWLEVHQANRRDFFVTPLPPLTVFGIAGNETADTVLTKGVINIREERYRRTFQIPIDSSGAFRAALPVEKGTRVNVWFSGHPDYTTNTFTILKKDLPASIGTIATCVNVYENTKKDTLKTIIDSLTYAQGLYFLALSDSSANNPVILEGIRGYENIGVIKWILKKQIIYNDLKDENGDTIPKWRETLQRDAIKFFTGGTTSFGITYDNKYESPIGVIPVIVDTAKGFGYPHPWEGYVIVKEESPPGNYYLPAGEDYRITAAAHTGRDDPIGTLISELGGAVGAIQDINNGLGGSNSFAFKTKDGVITEFTKEGKVVWWVVLTYKPGDFKIR
jgi:hypothetical protein